MAADIYDSLKPIHYTCKTVGIAMYSLQINKNGKKSYITTNTDVFTTLVSCAVCMVFIFLGPTSCSNNFLIVLAAITTNLQRYAAVAIGTTIFIASFAHKNLIKQVINMLYNLDSKLINQNKQKFYNAAYKRAIKVVVISLLVAGIMVAFDVYNMEYEGTSLLCLSLYETAYFLTVICECHLIILLMEIKHRFRVLNELILESSKVSPNIFGVIVPFGEQKCSRLSHNNLVKFSKIHSELCEISAMVNRCFEWQVTVKTVISFIYITASVFYLYIDLNFLDDLMEFAMDLFSFFYWIGFNIAELFLVVKNFCDTQKEVSTY